MRKLLGVMTGLVSVALLSGCGSSGKELTCTYDFGTTDPTTAMEYVFTFDKNGDSIQSYSETLVATYSDITEEEFEEEYSDAQSSCTEFTDMTGVTCTVDKSGNSISVSIGVDMAKLDDASKEELLIEYIEDLSYDEFKENMEGTGFTCK